jgi:hypothetical protein
MILDNLKVVKDGNQTKISCDVDGKELYYSFPSEFAKYVTDSFDPFFLAMLPVAMRLGGDIVIKGSLSNKLYHNSQSIMNIYLIMTHPYCKIVKILPDKLSSKKLESQDAVGSALTLGVDSLCCFEDYYFDKSCLESHKITHATISQLGHTGYGLRGEKTLKLHSKSIKEYTNIAGLPFLPVFSNVTELVQNIGQIWTFLNFSIPMLFPKLFSKYYQASTYSYRQQWWHRDCFQIGILDALLVPLMSTENLESILHGSQYNRIEKIARIHRNPLTHRFLGLCVQQSRWLGRPKSKLVQKELRTGNYYGSKGERLSNTKRINCSFCKKCMFVLVVLNYYGWIDNYSTVFDLGVYKRHKKQYLKELHGPGEKTPMNLEMIDFLNRGSDDS